MHLRHEEGPHVAVEAVLVLGHCASTITRQSTPGLLSRAPAMPHPKKQGSGIPDPAARRPHNLTGATPGAPQRSSSKQGGCWGAHSQPPEACGGSYSPPPDPCHHPCPARACSFRHSASRRQERSARLASHHRPRQTSVTPCRATASGGDPWNETSSARGTLSAASSRRPRGRIFAPSPSLRRRRCRSAPDRWPLPPTRCSAARQGTTRGRNPPP